MIKIRSESDKLGLLIIVITNLFVCNFTLYVILLLILLIKDFTGNTDRNSVVYHELNPPIRARYIRFIPVAWNSFIAMRVELYGCTGTVHSFFCFWKMSPK